jgi:hypothetical protein
MIASREEKETSFKMFRTISFSMSGPSARISLTSVIGAEPCLEAASIFPSRTFTGRSFINLCSTKRLTLERKKKEFKIAGSKAIIPIISIPPTITIAP